MKLQGVLWDMDGVLVDTGEFHYQSWKETLSELGVAFDRQAFSSIFGMNNALALKKIFGQQPSQQVLEEIADRKEAKYRAAIRGKAAFMPGVESWLRSFTQMGIPQAIASSAPQANIDALGKELGFDGFFQTIVSAYNIPSKPNPAVFLLTARNLQADPSACLVIEDSLVGVEAANRAGMSCIAVTTTHTPAALARANLVLARLTDSPVETALQKLGLYP